MESASKCIRLTVLLERGRFRAGDAITGCAAMGNCFGCVKDTNGAPTVNNVPSRNKKVLAEVDAVLRQWVADGSVEHEPPIVENVTFDPASRQDQVEFSNENRTVVYVGKGYSTSLVKMPNGQAHGFTTGRHAWSVRVDVSRCRSWMQIGIVTSKRKSEGCPQIFDGKPHPFRQGEIALRSDGNMVTGRREIPDTRGSERGYDTGDVISVRLDMDQKTIQWLKNGRTFQNEPEFMFDDDEVYASASLDNPKEQVTVLNYYGMA